MRSSFIGDALCVTSWCCARLRPVSKNTLTLTQTQRGSADGLLSVITAVISHIYLRDGGVWGERGRAHGRSEARGDPEAEVDAELRGSHEEDRGLQSVWGQQRGQMWVCYNTLSSSHTPLPRMRHDCTVWATADDLTWDQSGEARRIWHMSSMPWCVWVYISNTPNI